MDSSYARSAQLGQKSIGQDLEALLSVRRADFEMLENAKIFLTGGTGFIGCWLLESLMHANETLSLGLSVTILTRDPKRFYARVPHLANYDAYKFLTGDVQTFANDERDYSFVIHGATDASAELNEVDPRKMFDTIVGGTRRVLDFAISQRSARVLYLSSGAVYGQQPWEMTHVQESFNGAPNCSNPRNTYAEAKRAAEMLCSIYGKQFGLHTATARIFALLGPYLFLDIHFAAGNFIKDALLGKSITVQGNGMPFRSYLYASDLVSWLLRLMVKGEAGDTLNIGSDQGLSIKDLAKMISEVLGNGQISILGETDIGWNLGRYVPDVSLAKNKLGLTRTVELEEAILKTAAWNGWEKNKL